MSPTQARLTAGTAVTATRRSNTLGAIPGPAPAVVVVRGRRRRGRRPTRPAARVSRAHPGLQGGVPRGPRARRARRGGVEARARHAERAAHEPDWILVAVPR